MYPDQSWEYFYIESGVKQRTYTDGTVTFEFSDGQQEKRMPDGSVEIVFPDKTRRYIFANGEVYYHIINIFFPFSRCM